jgi:hypothetical protein
MSHYCGILIFFPIVLGEFIRGLINRKVDFSVWIAFLAGLFPVPLFYPLLQSSREYALTFWSKPDWMEVFSFYNSLLWQIGAFVLLLAVIGWFLLGSRDIEEPEKQMLFPAHESVAAVLFALLPVFAILLGKVVTGAYVHRYALPAVIGVSILIASLIRMLPGSRTFSVLVLPLFFAGFLLQSVIRYDAHISDAKAFHRTVEFLQTKSGDSGPIVCWFSHVPMQIWYYAPNALQKRVFYIADAEASVRYLGHDTIDRGLIALKQWFPLVNVVSYEAFVHGHEEFYLYHFSWDEDWKWNWLTTKLLEDHKRLELKARDGSEFMFLVKGN